MNKAFWILVAIDAALFLYLLVGTFGPRGGDSGGREMELMFSVILPGIVLAVAVVVFVFAKSQVARECLGDRRWTGAVAFRGANP